MYIKNADGFSHREGLNVKKTPKKKTFRVDITEGLSKDIDNLEKDLKINHQDLLRISVMWYDWRRIVYKIMHEYPAEFGIFLDKKMGLYKFTKEPKTDTEKKLGDVFRFMLLTGGMDKEEQEAYIELLLTEGLSAKDIFSITQSERPRQRKQKKK